MAYIQISNINGTPPFQFYICDYAGSNCELVQTENDPVYWPVNVYVPNTFEGIQSFMLKIIDSNLCETMTIYNCPTPTQTPTSTPTPTPSPLP